MIEKKQIVFLMLTGCASGPHFTESKKCETNTHEVQVYDQTMQRLTGYKKVFLESCETQATYYTTIDNSTIIVPEVFEVPEDQQELEGSPDQEDQDIELPTSEPI